MSTEARPADKRTQRIVLGILLGIVPAGLLFFKLFENHDTALYQIQEMLRTERISAEKALLHEIEGEGEVTVVTKKSIEAVRRLARGI